MYQVSNKGNIKSFYKNKILKPRKKENDYFQVCLYKQGINKKFYIHRLVAETFIENSENKEQVNHKDFNKSNNTVENLEWVSRIENLKHFRQSNKFKETYNRRERKLASKTIARVKNYKDRIIELYKHNYSIDNIATILKIGRDFVSDVLYLYDIC